MPGAPVSGAEWLAGALVQAGTTHVFFVESVLRRTLLALADRGVKLVLADSEKAAAYMADGYARVARRPGVCMAQSVAKCAAGRRAVLCFTGDGGFYYHLAELETARRCGIAVAVVVNNNSGFGQNLTGVHRAAGNRPGRGEALIRFGPTDFAAVARSFRVRGIRVEQAEEIAPALSAALGAGETVVVDVVTALEERAPEPWTPGRS